jgi:hypothetical protein
MFEKNQCALKTTGQFYFHAFVSYVSGNVEEDLMRKIGYFFLNCDLFFTCRK